MSSHDQDQQLEIEALESLFPGDGEFNKISSTEFEIKLSAHGQQLPSLVGATLHVTYTPTYPDSPPSSRAERPAVLVIINFEGLSYDKGLDKCQQEELHGLVKEEVSRNEGCPMVYMMADAAQTYLTAHNRPPQSTYDQMMERAAKTSEATTSKEQPRATESAAIKPVDQDHEDNGDDDDDDDYVDSGSDVSSDDESESRDSEDEHCGEFKGLNIKELCSMDDRITAKQFVNWHHNFNEEMIAKGVWKRKATRDDKLSGKQMFEIDHSLAKVALDEQNDDLTDSNSKVSTSNESAKLVWNDPKLFMEGDWDELEV